MIHLDAHYWRAGWTAPPDAAWTTQVAELIARESWVMEGNNGGDLSPRIAAADTVVFLDLPSWQCIAGVYTRWWKTRGREREDLAPGCPETLPPPQFVKWMVWDYPRRVRRNLVELLGRSTTRVVTLRSHAEVERYARSRS